MSYDFHDRTIVKHARTEHLCEEGGCERTRTILPGQSYEKHAGTYDGDFYHYKLCARCGRAWQRARERFGPWHEDDGPCLHYLLDYLRDRRSDDQSLDAVRARRAAREDRRERLRKPPELWLVEDLAACGQVRRWVPSVDPLQQRRPESVADWGSAARFDEAGAREWASRWPCLQAVRAADVRASVAYVVLADGVRP